MTKKLVECFRKQIRVDYIRIIIGGLQLEDYDPEVGKPEEKDIAWAIQQLSQGQKGELTFPFFTVYELKREAELAGKIILWKKEYKYLEEDSESEGNENQDNENENEKKKEKEKEKEILYTLSHLRESKHSTSMEIFELSLKLLQSFNDNLSTLAHELRTPVAEVSMLIQDTLDNPHLQESNLNTALEACRHASNLIQDLTDVCRATRGAVELDLSDVVVCTELEHVFKLYKVKCEERKVNLVYDCCLAADLQVVTDGPRFRRIFTNLIGNALKFVPSNGDGQITVQSKATPYVYPKGSIVSSSSSEKTQSQADTQDKEYIKLEFGVIDNGKGIKKELQHMLFTQFFQGDASIRGEGIGLHMVKNIINAMGGDIWIESEEGKGASVYFYFICEAKRIIFPPAMVTVMQKLKTLTIGIVDCIPDLSAALHTVFFENQIFNDTQILDPEDKPSILSFNKDVLFIDAHTYEKLRLGQQDGPSLKVKNIVLTTPVYYPKPDHTFVIQHPMKRSEVFGVLTQLATIDEPAASTAPPRPRNERKASIKSDSLMSPPPSPPSLPKNRKKILLVEDNAVISQVLSKKMTKQGYFVFACSTEDDVNNALASFDYNYVLMDVNLWGDLDGFDVSRKIRDIESFKKRPFSKIICISEISQGDFESRNHDAVMNCKIDSQLLIKDLMLMEKS